MLILFIFNIPNNILTGALLATAFEAQLSKLLDRNARESLVVIGV